MFTRLLTGKAHKLIFKPTGQKTGASHVGRPVHKHTTKANTHIHLKTIVCDVEVKHTGRHNVTRIGKQ